MLPRRGEIREVAGRQLRGMALPFEIPTEIAPGQFEQFSRGSVTTTGEALMTVNHEPGRILAREPATLKFETRRDGLYLTADVPETSEGNDILALVKAKTLRSLSVEFRPLAERQEGSLRVIDAALISGVSVVARPAYSATSLEARAIEGAKIRAAIPFNVPLTCACHNRGNGECDVVSFAPNTFDNSLFGPDARNVLAITDTFGSALAGTKTGGMVITKGRRELKITVNEIADTTRGRDLLEQISQGLIVARPVYINGEFTETNGVAAYTSAELRSILFSPTDLTDWQPVKSETRARPPARRRRQWL